MSTQQLPPPPSPTITIEDVIAIAVKWGQINGRSVKVQAWDGEKIFQVETSADQYSALELVGKTTKEKNR
jgi:hypothetical protein